MVSGGNCCLGAVWASVAGWGTALCIPRIVYYCHCLSLSLPFAVVLNRFYPNPRVLHFFFPLFLILPGRGGVSEQLCDTCLLAGAKSWHTPQTWSSRSILKHKYAHSQAQICSVLLFPTPINLCSCNHCSPPTDSKLKIPHTLQIRTIFCFLLNLCSWYRTKCCDKPHEISLAFTGQDRKLQHHQQKSKR